MLPVGFTGILCYHQAVGRLGVPMSQQELVAIAKRLDVNADGLIDYYEFSKLIDLETTEMYAIVFGVCLCSHVCVVPSQQLFL